jgi:hypothetical protein
VTVPHDGVRPVVRKVLAAVLLVLIIGGAATARVVWAGEREIALSTESLKAGDADDAIVHARAAALWYAPGAPHVRVAYERLLAIAKEAEDRRLWETALFAYRAIVTASTSTKWAVVPHEQDARHANEAIARIEAKVGVRAPQDATEPADVIEAQLLESLAAEPGPTAFHRALLAASFVAMIAGLAAFLRFGLDESGRVRFARATVALVAAGAGLVGYAAALFLA